MEPITVFFVGSAGYSLLEILWRGHTHWTMSLTGGICFLLIYSLDSRLPIPFWLKVILCGILITLIELLVGLLVNRLLSWNVWDYSRVPFNLMGQISLPYALLWLLLSAALLPLCRLLNGVFS